VICYGASLQLIFGAAILEFWRRACGIQRESLCLTSKKYAEERRHGLKKLYIPWRFCSALYGSTANGKSYNLHVALTVGFARADGCVTDGPSNDGFDLVKAKKIGKVLTWAKVLRPEAARGQETIKQPSSVPRSLSQTILLVSTEFELTSLLPSLLLTNLVLIRALVYDHTVLWR
jgi:hypothetical protein